MPPLPAADMVPVAVPKHLTLLEFITAVSTDGCVIVPLAKALQP